MGGLARLAPVIGVLFFIPAMNLAGIPPMSGFIGKVGLMQAGLADGSWLALVLVAGSVLCSLLTLYAVAKTWGLASGAARSRPTRWPRRCPTPTTPPPSCPRGRRGPRRGAAHDGPPPRPRPRRPATFGDRDLESARALRDDDDAARDLFQLLEADALPKRLPALMVAPAAALVGVSLLITLVGGPLYGYTDRAAVDLLERTPYLSAVLGDEGNR